jgi:hypothetical protein
VNIFQVASPISFVSCWRGNVKFYVQQDCDTYKWYANRKRGATWETLSGGVFKAGFLAPPDYFSESLQAYNAAVAAFESEAR